MAIKDLFGKQSNKLVTAQDAENVSNEVESRDLVRAELARRKTFVPQVNLVIQRLLPNMVWQKSIILILLGKSIKLIHTMDRMRNKLSGIVLPQT